MSNPRPTPPRKPQASLVRRAAPAVVLTASGLALLMQLDRPASLGGSGDLALGVTGAGAAGSVSATGTRAAPAAAVQPPATQAAPPTTSAPATVAARRPAPVTKVPVTPAPAAKPPGTAPPAGSGACTGQNVSGPVVQTRWGPVQVAATVSADGRLCAVDAVQHPGGRGQSVAINDYAVPRLNARALKAGVNFDAVSGATITSEGYRRSLQSLLDAAG